MKITFGLAPQHHDAINRVANTGIVTATDLPLMRDLAGAINQSWDAGVEWPTPPGVVSLTQPQKNALFAAETGIGPMSAWIALMPGVDDATLNVYKQFYGPSAGGWGEVQFWYAHR